MFKINNIKKFLNIKLAAFGTFETILSLTITCIMMISALQFLKVYQQYNKNLTTKNHMKQVYDSIVNYVKCNGVMPYPDKDGNGVQMHIPETSDSWSTDYMHGFIPYKTIGISKQIAYDGEGNRIKYSMSPVFGERNSIPNSSSNDIRVIASNLMANYGGDAYIDNKSKKISFSNGKDFQDFRKLNIETYTSYLYVRSEDKENLDDLIDIKSHLLCSLFVNREEIIYNAQYPNPSLNYEYFRSYNINNLFVEVDSTVDANTKKNKSLQNCIMCIIYTNGKSIGNKVEIANNKDSYLVLTRFFT